MRLGGMAGGADTYESGETGMNRMEQIQFLIDALLEELPDCWSRTTGR